MGTSPIAYVHELRIKKAKEILKSDYGTISEIAKSPGYLNIYDFSRDFKKIRVFHLQNIKNSCTALLVVQLFCLSVYIYTLSVIFKN